MSAIAYSAATAQIARERERHDVLSRLTGCDLQVLGLVATGLDNRAIARHLNVSVTTVRSHVRRLLSKLGVPSRLEATAVAHRYELVPPCRTWSWDLSPADGRTDSSVWQAIPIASEVGQLSTTGLRLGPPRFGTR